MQPQPLIVVSDVEASSRWYQKLLHAESAHGGPEYERLTHDGKLITQLQAWDVHDHQHLGDPNSKPFGNGVLLWFQTDEFDTAVARARELNAKILEDVHVNGRQGEIWLGDPDGPQFNPEPARFCSYLVLRALTD